MKYVHVYICLRVHGWWFLKQFAMDAKIRPMEYFYKS